MHDYCMLCQAVIRDLKSMKEHLIVAHKGREGLYCGVDECIQLFLINPEKEKKKHQLEKHMQNPAAQSQSNKRAVDEVDRVTVNGDLAAGGDARPVKKARGEMSPVPNHSVSRPAQRQASPANGNKNDQVINLEKEVASLQKQVDCEP